jgi:hypothetical protein
MHELLIDLRKHRHHRGPGRVPSPPYVDRGVVVEGATVTV